MRREERNDAIARGALPPTMPFRLLLLTVKATAAGHRAVELWKQAGCPAIEGPFPLRQPPRTTSAAHRQQTVALRPETSGASQLGPSPLRGRS